MAKYIIHLADLHIGSDSGRDREYALVFEAFHKYISNLRSPSEYITVICGDIFHHKIRYSSSDIVLFNTLMKMICNIMPCIIIPGNHDVNINNNIVDLITPILEPRRDNKYPIHYISKTCNVVLYGISFYHVAVTDTTPDLTALAPHVAAAHNTIHSTIYPTVLLYHGMVCGAVFGKHICNDSVITKAFMNKFNITLLGDVHEHQYITKFAAYPGSLIQQNLSESPEKGFIIWDVATRISQFVILPNDSSMLRLDVRNLSAEAILKQIAAMDKPSNLLKLSIICDNELNDNVIKAISNKMGRLDYVRRYDSVRIDTEGCMKTAMSQVLEKLGADEKQMSEILAMQAPTVVYKKWSIVSLSWDNLFRYGTGNIIDFSKLSGLTGVIAPNMAGKSSIIDILVLAIWGKLLRGDKKSMIHSGALTSRVTAIIYADKWYKITRQDDRKKHPTVKLFSCDTEDGVYNDITEVSIDTTYKKIRTIVGELIHFQLTSLFNDHNIDLINTNSVNKIKYIMELFGVTENSQRIKEAKLQHAALQNKISSLVKPRYDVLEFVDKRDELNTRRDQLQYEYDMLSICELCECRDPNIIRSELANVIVVEAEFAPYAEECTISPADAELATASTKPSELIRQIIGQLSGQMPQLAEQYNVDAIDDELRNLIIDDVPCVTYIGEIEELKRSLNNISTDDFGKLLHYTELLKIENGHNLSACGKIFSFNTNCGECHNNINIINKSSNVITISHDEVLQEIGRISYEKSRYEQHAARLKDIIQQHDINTAKNIIRNNNMARVDLLQTQRRAAIMYAEYSEQLKTALNIERARDLYTAHTAYKKYTAWTAYRHAHELSIKLKTELEFALCNYTAKLKYDENLKVKSSLQRQISELDRSIGAANSAFEQYQHECNIKAAYDDAYPKLEHDLRREHIYIMALQSPHLRNSIINAGMGSVITIVNSILTHFGFTVEMQLDAELLLYIVDDKRLPVDMACGLQRFAISLAVRIALCQLLPMPDFIIVDEGFGVADNLNIQKLKNILHECAGSLSFMFCISHIESLQNTLLRPLEITIMETASKLTNAVTATADTNDVCSCGKKITSSRARHLLSKYHISRTKNILPA